MDRNQELEEMAPNDSDPLLGRRESMEEEASAQLSPPQPATVSPLEIEDEETDGSSAACCHICLEAESEIGDELISPCMCKGTQQFVHRSCLDHWRSVKEGFAFSHCTTCKAQFHLRVETWEDNSWRKMKFRLFVARDVFLVFLAVQLTIAIIGAIAYFLDRDGSFRNSFSDSWDRFLSKHPIPFYYCVGVVVFFVFRDDSALLVLQRQPGSVPCWVPELLLWLGHPGLPACFIGGMLCPGVGIHRRVCHPRHCLRFPRSNHGRPEDLAEALSHPDQKGAHKGIHSGRSSRQLHGAEA